MRFGIGRNERGSSMVQFAIASTLLFSMIFFLIEFSQVTFRYNTIGSLAKDAARYASVHGQKATVVADSAYIQTYVNGKNSGFTVIAHTTWPDGNKDPGSRVQVQVETSITPSTAIIPHWALTLRSTAQVLISR